MVIHNKQKVHPVGPTIPIYYEAQSTKHVLKLYSNTHTQNLLNYFSDITQD
jgi:hypothetical protein